MSPLHLRAKRISGRYLLSLAAAWALFKVSVAASSSCIPGQPFHGFGAREWLLWVVSTVDMLYLAVVILLPFVAAYWAIRRLTVARTCIWAGLLGAFIGVLTSFDLVARTGAALDRLLPQANGAVGTSIGIFGLVLVGLGVPLATAWLLRPQRSRKAPP